MNLQLAKKAGLSAASLLLVLLAAEIGLRIFGIAPDRFPRPKWQVWYNGSFRDSNIWGNGLVKTGSRFKDQGVVMGEYVPGAIFKCIYASNPRGYFDADNGVVMTVNQLGMRGGGYPVSIEKTPGVLRLLILGDSFTFGVGVRDGDTFCREIERRLSGSTVSGMGTAEVLNAGVQGYNTRDQVINLENRWLAALDPDVVLIVFYVNDAYSDSMILNNGEALGIYLRQPDGLAKVSRVYDLAQHKLQSRKQSKAVEEFYREQFFSNARTVLANPQGLQMDWTACRASLQRAAGLLKSRNKRFGLVIFPELYNLNSRYPFSDVHGLVKDTCGELGIPVLDLQDAFRGMDAEDLWVHPSDHHPNERAHAIAGKAIADFVDLKVRLEAEDRELQQQIIAEGRR